MHHDIFTQLSLVLALAVAVSFVMRILRQPLLIGYIITGVIVGPSLLHLIDSPTTFEAFAELGVALLLFITGMELNARVVKEVGKVTVITGLVQLTGIGLIGFAVTQLVGFTLQESIFIAMALYFSSTIIVVKLLNDRHEQTRLFAKIAIGLLLIEDLIATIALVFVAAGSEDGSLMSTLGGLIARGGLLALILILFSTQILPRITHFLGKSQEFLFLFALGWGFGIATLFDKSGFSIEVGALFAGVSLASMSYAREIGARLKPLRDFFLVVFFIALGEGLQIAHIGDAWIPAIILSLVVLLLKPLVIMSTMGLLGYTKRTSFKAAIFLDQISEFSLIFIVLAYKNGLVSQEVVTVITLVALITITASTYMIKYADNIFNYIDKHLRFFERHLVEPKREIGHNYSVVLFGYRKGGHEFVRTLQHMKEKFVVVDYDPDVIEILERQKVDYLYGDATDGELLNEMDLRSTKMVISTITDQPTNMFLVRQVLHANPKANFICHSDTIEEALELYESGATYVMMPHYIGSEKISSFIKKNGMKKSEFKRHREKHLLELQRRDD